MCLCFHVGHLRPLHLGQSHRSCPLHRLGGREEEKWKFVREGEKKKIPGFEPTGKLILPVASTSSLSSQRWIFKTIKPK